MLRRPVIWVALAVVLVLGGLVAFWWGLSGGEQRVRIATGGSGGTYLPLGRGLAEVFNATLPDRVEAEALETAGSGDNVGRLARGEVELAIVQNDTEVGPDVRALAPLYPEVLHVVVREGVGIERLGDLAGHPASAGPEGSGTDVLVTRVLEHFGRADLAEELVHCSTSEAVERFEAGELDVVFLVSGVRSSSASRLLDGDGTLLSIGDPAQVGSALDGLRVSQPFLVPSVIAARTYGTKPAEPVGTVAVEAILVARTDLDEDLVYELTGAIYANRVALMRAHRAGANISEQFDPSTLQAPLHDGAERYYRRDRPPAYVEYADFISLIFAIFVAGGSAILGFSRWIRQTKKDRIDVYYLDIRSAMEAWASGEIDTDAAKAKLEALRAKAFDELVAERLSADQSFTIFQDYVTSELLRVQRGERG